MKNVTEKTETAPYPIAFMMAVVKTVLWRNISDYPDSAYESPCASNDGCRFAEKVSFLRKNPYFYESFQTEFLRIFVMFIN